MIYPEQVHGPCWSFIKYIPMHEYTVKLAKDAIDLLEYTFAGFRDTAGKGSIRTVLPAERIE
jgi:hypothetical protein